jgi:LemA protein
VSVADRVLAVVLVILVVAVVWLVAMYNRLVRSRNRVREAWSGVDVQLQRRSSLIPNIVESVRGYAAHERATFDEVARARAVLQRADGAAAAASANTALTEALGRLLVVAEAYPELHASANFAGLQQELANVEERIAFARQFYNRNVLDYNTRLETVPVVVVARSFGFAPAEFFSAPDESRADVKVSFVPPAAPTPAPGATSPRPRAPERGDVSRACSRL